MAQETFKRGQVVRYGQCQTGSIEAKVLRVHRDNSCTVEATFFVSPAGERRPGYLGYRYRIHNSNLASAA
jgi:hypothetical protein